MRLLRLISIFFLAISLFNAKVSAQEIKEDYTYGEIELAMLEGDFAGMQNQIQFIEDLLASGDIKSAKGQVALNEALGLLYLQLGYLKEADAAFDRCWERVILYYPGSRDLQQRILTGLMLSNMDNYMKVIDYLNAFVVEEEEMDSQYYHFNLGIGATVSQEYELAEEELSLAAELSMEAVNSSERWAAINYHRILDFSADNYLGGGRYDYALSIRDAFQQVLRQSLERTNSYYDISSELKKARIYMLLGNLARAKESLNVAERQLAGANSLVTGFHLELLELRADILSEEGQYDLAFDLYDQAKSMMKILGRDDSSLMVKHMTCAFKDGRIEDSESISDSILDRINGPEDINYAIEFFYQYANILLERGQSPLAMEMLELGLTIPEFSDYDSRLRLRNAMGSVFIKSGDYSSAVALYSDIVKEEKQRAHDIFAFLPEGQRELYWKKKEPLMNNIFKLNQAGTVSAARGSVFEINKGDKNIGSTILYDASLLNKGLLLEAFLNMQRMISSSGDTELVAAFEELRKLNGSDPQRAETLEATIMTKLRSFGDFMDFTRITWKDVRDNLEEDEAAIEFVVSENDEVSYYSAEILRKGYDRPQHVFLFAQKNEDVSLKGMDVYDNDRLYKKTWAKMLKYLEGCKDIYFAPVGEFHRIGMEYLPVDESSRMNDIYNMHRLSSTKILASGKEDLKGMRASSAALYGGLDYNLDSENMEYYAYAAQTGRRGQPSLSPSDTRSLDGVNWAYLRGTAAEVENISGILQDMKCEADVYTGGEGVEESFKLLDSKSPEIIHVATHGFFFEPSKDVSLSTGLVFAGANNHANGGMADKGIDDGLLTSREIAGLNLSGADLVVLSACQTGTGEISGEGVFGLQRGFKKACAGTLLMSLWEVDDNATSELMTQFYSCLSKGMEKHKALKEAQNHVKQTCGQDPALWAGFILLD